MEYLVRRSDSTSTLLKTNCSLVTAVTTPSINHQCPMINTIKDSSNNTSTNSFSKCPPVSIVTEGKNVLILARLPSYRGECPLIIDNAIRI
jgi:hypothetical protein